MEAVQGSQLPSGVQPTSTLTTPPDISLPKGTRHPSDLKPTADSQQSKAENKEVNQNQGRKDSENMLFMRT